MKKIENDSTYTKRPNRIYALDILRIACVLLIFLFHMNLHFEFTTGIDVVDKFISQGNFSMTIFFVLSGYGLYLGYGDIDFSVNFQSIICFIKKRLKTIWVPYVLIIMLNCALGSYISESRAQNLILFPAYFLGLQCLFPDMHPFFGNSGLWFVSVIIILYLIYPIIQTLVQKTSKKRWFGLIIVYLMLVYVICVYSYFGSGRINYYVYFIYRIPEFILGVVLCDIKKRILK